MKKFWGLLQAGLKVILAGALAVGAWFALTPYFRVDRNTEGDFFKNLPENTLDVLCLGSSHMQFAFNPAIFYAKTGLYSYVMGSACQPFTISASMLEECLKTQDPEAVLVDVFTLLPQSEVCYAYGAYYLAIDAMTGKTRFHAADDVPDDDYKLSYRYDLIMNHDNWKTMDWSNIREIIDNPKRRTEFNYNLGYVSQEPENLRFTPLWVPEVKYEYTLTEEEKRSIDKIVNMCRDAGARIIFIKTPYQIDDDDMAKLDAIWKYIETLGVEYVDYIVRAEELGWFMDMDGDTWHNNTWGAEIITGDLADLFNEKGYVTGHKTDPTWEELEGFAVRATTNSLMGPKNIDVYRLLNEAATYPCYVAVSYRGKNFTSIGEEENALLQRIGFTKDFAHEPQGNYFAVVRNGELVQESTEPFAFELAGTTISLGYDGIMFDGKPYDRTGEMDLVFMAEDLMWINTMPIDYATRWFWKSYCDGWSCE
ncbi:MAG: hypothetical protein IJJ29_09905 [Solobacterium sp.]|nr:hypothetical protein [Solobacterium sp.]